MRKLTAKQKAFVREYLIDLNGAQAAIRAGYSEKTARIIANENLIKPDIAEAIQSEMNKRSERTRVTSDKVLREAAKVSFFNVDSILDQDGKVLPLNDWPEEASAAIKSIDFSTDEDGITRIRRISFWDKMKAIELLGKHLRTWDQTQESNERDLIGSLLKSLKSLKSLEPTTGPPALRNTNGKNERPH